MSNTLSVTLGRNLPREENRPMSRRDWARFQDEAERTIYTITGREEASTVHTGTGVWEGVREESAVLSYFDIDVSTAQHDRLVAWLGQIARTFGQDSIAVMYAPVTFAA